MPFVIPASTLSTETLASVRAEFLAGGFNRLGATVADRLINDAYAWLINKHLWPFREQTLTGAAPLTVDDLGAVGSVTNTADNDRRLVHVERRTIVEQVGDLTTTGVPNLFYIEDGTVVRTYPVGGTLSVRYWRAPSPLIVDVDVLLVPNSWVQLVLDRARYRACLRQQDWAGAATLRTEVDESLNAMVMDQLGKQVSDPELMIVYGGEGS